MCKQLLGFAIAYILTSTFVDYALVDLTHRLTIAVYIVIIVFLLQLDRDYRELPDTHLFRIVLSWIVTLLTFVCVVYFILLIALTLTTGS